MLISSSKSVVISFISFARTLFLELLRSRDAEPNSIFFNSDVRCALASGDELAMELARAAVLAIAFGPCDSLLEIIDFADDAEQESGTYWFKAIAARRLAAATSLA